MPYAGFDDGRHGSVAPRGLDAQLPHERVIDVQSGFHMANHIIDMVIWFANTIRC